MNGRHREGWSKGVYFGRQVAMVAKQSKARHKKKKRKKIDGLATTTKTGPILICTVADLPLINT